jgi:opacity protein-like surface antigen
MTRFSKVLFVTVLCLLASAPLARAQQGSLYIGAGATFPTSDFGDYADTGWMITGGALVPVGPEGLSVGVEGFYGRNGHSESDDTTKPMGVMPVVLYSFDTGTNVQPYVYGGGGLMVRNYTSETSQDVTIGHFGYQAGAGVGFQVNEGTSLYVEGRYMGSEDLKFFGVNGGVSVTLGR